MKPEAIDAILAASPRYSIDMGGNALAHAKLNAARAIVAKHLFERLNKICMAPNEEECLNAISDADAALAAWRELREPKSATPRT